MPKPAAARGDRQHGDGDVGLFARWVSSISPEVHAVELIARQDQHVFDPGLLDVAHLLADGVGRALIPVGPFVGLLGGEDFDEAAVEGVEF